MDLSDKDALGDAIARLAALNPLPSELLSDYLAGRRPRLLYYDKLSGGESSDIPALWKYILSAESYRAQPSIEKYYDIFRAARAVPLLRRLAEAESGLDDHPALRLKLNRLAVEPSYDAFDQILYELVVAHAYRRIPGVERVQFVEESSTPTPDLRIEGGGHTLHVECKKFDRSRDIAGPLRDEVNSRLEPLFTQLRRARKSAVVELEIKEPDGKVYPLDVAEAAITSLRTGAIILGADANVQCSALPPYRSSDLLLTPSPLHMKRYGYSSRSEWLGLAMRMQATFAGRSWIDEMRWDAAVKWKLSSPTHRSSRIKLGHKRLFHGIRQLSTTFGPTVLHVCYEREGGIGHRREELVRFVEQVEVKLAGRHITPPTIVVFNELDIDVSEAGRFDFVERAHWWKCDKASGEPVVSMVFVPPDEMAVSGGEWGVGTDLPSIDL